MSIAERLEKEGWFLTEDGINHLSGNGSPLSCNDITQKALNTDLKEIGKDIIQGNHDNITQMILQVQKVRNISAPKSNPNSQAAPRMIKFVLSDGHNYIQAIELDSSGTNINPNNIPPGSKIKIKSAKIKNGLLLLDRNSFSILGGKVTALHEKWELSKSLSNQQRNTGNDGPPKWTNFGQKISATDVHLTKSLDKGVEKQNVEFELTRKGAITEASANAVKKVFGGGTKQMFQPQQQYEFKKIPEPTNESRPFNQERPKRGKRESKEPSEKPQKPPEKVSLFDFLETKLHVPESAESVQKYSPNCSDAYKVNGNYYNYNATQETSRPKYKNSDMANRYQSNTSYNQTGASHNQYGASRNQYNAHANYNQNNASYGQNKASYGQNNAIYNQNNASYHQSNAGYFQNNTGYNPNNARYNQSNTGYDQNNAGYNQKHANYNQNNASYNQYSASCNQNEASYQQLNNYAHKPHNDFGYNQKQESRSGYKGKRSDVRNYEQVSKSADFNKNPHTTQATCLTNSNKPEDFMSQSTALSPSEKQSADALATSMRSLSVNGAYASRTLKQHLNLSAPPPKDDPEANHDNAVSWKVGDYCMAKYWEDNKFYKATVTAVTDRTCVVRFNDYGNYEEILKQDCLPVQGHVSQQRKMGTRTFGNKNYFNKQKMNKD